MDRKKEIKTEDKLVTTDLNFNAPEEPKADPVLPAIKEKEEEKAISIPASTTPPPVVANNAMPYKEGLQNMVIAQLAQGQIGTLSLTQEQEQILYSDFDDKEVLIRPDGLVYLPWSWYASRLRKAFGLQWQLIPADNPQTAKTPTGKPAIIWSFYLFIKGVMMGYAVGEHIEERQSALSFGESCESAKSNALMRLCKGIGMSLKLWDKEYVEAWKSAYAKNSVNQRSGRTEWTKLSDAELNQKRDNFIKSVHAIKMDRTVYQQTLADFGYQHANEVKLIDYQKVYLALKGKEQKNESKNEQK